MKRPFQTMATRNPPPLQNPVAGQVGFRLHLPIPWMTALKWAVLYSTAVFKGAN